jgi:acetate kinase
VVDHIAGPAPDVRLVFDQGDEQRTSLPPGDHTALIAGLLDRVRAHAPAARIEAVGHRIVHGGPDFAEPVLLDDPILAALERLVPLAPLHQPHNLAGVRAARAIFPEAAQIGCFDTAFHRGQPRLQDLFALPRRFFDEGVRRYGFHGLSYEYVSGALAEHWPAEAAGRCIIANLGSGASMCALNGGRSVGSTMGFSALDGMPMGTRCGRIDPGVLLWMMREKGIDAAAIEAVLCKESGLLGLSGVSGDLRAVEAAGTPEAAEAIAYFVTRAQREIGGLAALLGGLDALIFTGGIGEHAARVRGAICDGLGWLGLVLDPARNAAHDPRVSADASRIAALVIPTNEELMIARRIRRLRG